MILVPLKYHRELSKMNGTSLVKTAVKTDRFSIVFVYMAEYVAIFLLVTARAFGISLGFVALPLSVMSLGVILIIIGEVFRLWATYTLGRSFTYVVVTSKKQKLITKGPYNLVRHPSYFGGLLVVIGFGIVSQSLATAALYILFLCAAYAYRIHVEENALVRRFGREYKEYADRIAMIVPGIHIKRRR